MNPCENCPIDDKLYECCGRHPETGESVRLRLADGRIVNACPYLSPEGFCLVYENRPYGCRMHRCGRFERLEPEQEGIDIFASVCRAAADKADDWKNNSGFESNL